MAREPDEDTVPARAEGPARARGRRPAAALARRPRLQRSDDERLAQLVARGQDPAFTLIYERYHQAIYRYCRTIVREDRDAEDALQNAMANALLALRVGQRNAPLRPWLYRIAHNEAVSILRRRREGEGLEQGDTQAVTSAEQAAADRARFAQLLDDLRALPPRLRSALVMRELADLSHEEIAVALETSVGAAKQAVFEARKALAELSAGRAAACEEIRALVSHGDRRTLHGRRVRAHVRECRECAAFAAAIPARRGQLHALAPVLAPAAAAGVLARASAARAAEAGALGATSGATGAGLPGALAVVKPLVATVAGKALMGGAVLAAVAALAVPVHGLLAAPGTPPHHELSRAGPVPGVARRRESSASPPATAVVPPAAARARAQATHSRPARARAGAPPNTHGPGAGRPRTAPGAPRAAALPSSRGRGRAPVGERGPAPAARPERSHPARPATPGRPHASRGTPSVSRAAGGSHSSRPKPAGRGPSPQTSPTGPSPGAPPAAGGRSQPAAAPSHRAAKADPASRS